MQELFALVLVLTISVFLFLKTFENSRGGFEALHNEGSAVKDSKEISVRQRLENLGFEIDDKRLEVEKVQDDHKNILAQQAIELQKVYDLEKEIEDWKRGVTSVNLEDQKMRSEKDK